MNNQKIKKDFNEKLAECVGLWLAEGDNKSNYEITFTNNCWNLIKLFHKTITKLFGKENIRIYVYNSSKKQIKIPIKAKVNYYLDKRATKPYYIWRLASSEFNKKWKIVTNKILSDEEYYCYVLRGIFAGEGNIKTGQHSNRTIRISQKEPSEFFNLLLNNFDINYTFVQNERSYVITGKTNWDKCAKIKIADLHPDKKLKFWQTYGEFKEEHYPNNYLRESILKVLERHHTSNGLSIKFNRSQARVYDILGLLKKSNKIQNFRVASIDYWIRKDQKIIIISKLKANYLNFLGDSIKTTKEFARYFKVDWKSSFRRLNELEKLSLVKRNKDKTWGKLNVDKKVISI